MCMYVNHDAAYEPADNIADALAGVITYRKGLTAVMALTIRSTRVSIATPTSVIPGLRLLVVKTGCVSPPVR